MVMIIQVMTLLKFHTFGGTGQILRHFRIIEKIYIILHSWCFKLTKTNILNITLKLTKEPNLSLSYIQHNQE